MDGLLDGTTSMANPLQSVMIVSRFGRRKERKVERWKEREREKGVANSWGVLGVGCMHGIHGMGSGLV